MDISLKSQNRPLLIAFTICLGAVFWWTSQGRTEFALLEKLDGYFGSALVVAVGTIITMAIGELIPRPLKLVLIYWRIRHAAPGHRAFTKHAPADHRISLKELTKKHGVLPREPKKQDELFYQIYSPLSNQQGVKDAHKSYLLFRELACLSLVAFIIGAPSVYWLSRDLTSTLIFGAVSGTSYLVFALSAKNAGVRLVTNTLAAASAC